MRDENCSVEDHVLVFDLIIRVVEETEKLAMKQGQPIVCLLHLLTKNSAKHVRSASSDSRSGGLVCLPDAV